MEEDLNKRKDHSIIIAALIFIILATIFTIVVYKQMNFGKFNIPFYIVIAGMFFFAISLETEGRVGEWIASLGWTLIMLGLTLFYQYGTGNWEGLIYMWPLIFPSGLGLGQLAYGAVKGRKNSFERGKSLIFIGIGIFILCLILFKLFF